MKPEVPASREDEGRSMVDCEATDDIELDLLLDGIFRCYGYDFRDYARASLRRRVHTRMGKEGLRSVSELQARVLRDPECMSRLLGDLSIHITEMFRDPSFFRAIRNEVVPILRTYPFVRIWDAGCSTGEEAYSLAIILEEEGLYERSQIYATDMNKRVLETARSGIFRLSTMRENTQNYLAAGGTGSFSDYYTARYESAVFSPDLKRQIVFAQHNLVTDARFNSFNLIICRNVMIYFNRDLQERVFALFHSSLERFGIIGIGKKESLRFDPLADRFEALNEEERIYKRTE